MRNKFVCFAFRIELTNFPENLNFRWIASRINSQMNYEIPKTVIFQCKEFSICCNRKSPADDHFAPKVPALSFSEWNNFYQTKKKTSASIDVFQFKMEMQICSCNVVCPPSLWRKSNNSISQEVRTLESVASEHDIQSFLFSIALK